MSSNQLEPPHFNPEFYSSWKKEMRLWQLATNFSPARKAPAVFLSLEGQAPTAILEMGVALLHSNDGIYKLIE